MTCEQIQCCFYLYTQPSICRTKRGGKACLGMENVRQWKMSGGLPPCRTLPSMCPGNTTHPRTSPRIAVPYSSQTWATLLPPSILRKSSSFCDTERCTGLAVRLVTFFGGFLGGIVVKKRCLYPQQVSTTLV